MMIVDDDGFTSVTVPLYVVVFSVMVSALTGAAATRPANASAETRTEQERRFMVLILLSIRAASPRRWRVVRASVVPVPSSRLTPDGSSTTSRARNENARSAC